MNIGYNQEWLSLTSLYSLVLFLQVMPYPTWVKRILGAPLWGGLMASHTNNKMDLKAYKGQAQYHLMNIHDVRKELLSGVNLPWVKKRSLKPGLNWNKGF
jgi:hypothetical protein